jgi:hypothetical protein
MSKSGQVGHKSFQCKNRSNHIGGNNGNGTAANYGLYCRKPIYDKKNSNSRRRKVKMAMSVILTVTVTSETTSHRM